MGVTTTMPMVTGPLSGARGVYFRSLVEEWRQDHPSQPAAPSE